MTLRAHGYAQLSRGMDNSTRGPGEGEGDFIQLTERGMIVTCAFFSSFFFLLEDEQRPADPASPRRQRGVTWQSDG